MSRSDDVAEAKPRSDAYTGMLAISLIALVTGCVLLYLDYSRYSPTRPPPVPTVAPVGPQAPGGDGKAAAPVPEAKGAPEPKGPPDGKKGP